MFLLKWRFKEISYSNVIFMNTAKSPSHAWVRTHELMYKIFNLDRGSQMYGSLKRKRETSLNQGTSSHGSHMAYQCVLWSLCTSVNNVIPCVMIYGTWCQKTYCVTDSIWPLTVAMSNCSACEEHQIKNQDASYWRKLGDASKSQQKLNLISKQSNESNFAKENNQ